MIDGAPLAIDAALFEGRVCLLTDPRDPVSCAATGAGNLTVHLGSANAVTTADGTFTIAASGATPWTVTGAGIVTSVKVQADYLIPVMTTTMYSSLCSNNGVTMPGSATAPGQGALMIHVIRNGAGYTGSTAVSQQPNPARYLAFYDTTTTTVWTQTAAGSHGDVWFPGIDVGTTAALVAAPGGTPTLTDGGEPILDGAITWSDVIFN